MPAGSRAKRAFWVLGALSLSLLGLSATQAQLAAARARAALVHALSQRLGAQVEVERVELSLASRKLSAHGVKVRASWGRVDAQALSAPVSALDLLRGEVSPDGLELRGATLELAPRGADPMRADLAGLRTLRLRDSALTLRLPGAVVALSGARLDIDGERVSFSAARGTWRADGGRAAPAALGRVELSGRRSAQRIAPERVAFSLGGAHVVLSDVVVEPSIERGFSAHVRADGELGPLLADALPFAIERLEAKGAITGRVSTAPQTQSIVLDARLDSLGVAGRRLAEQVAVHLEREGSEPRVVLRARLAGGSGRPPLGVEAVLEPGTKGVALSALQLQLGETRLAGKGELVGERLSAQVAAEDAAIDDVVAQLAAPRAASGAIAGRGRVELGLSGTLGAPELTLKAELQRGTLLGAAFDRAALVARSAGPDAGLVIESLSAQRAHASVSAKDLRVGERDGRTILSGELQVTRLPLAELWSFIGTAQATAAALQGEADGRIQLAPDAHGAPSAALRLTLHAASLYGLRFSEGALDCVLAGDGRVELASLQLRGAGGASLALEGALGGEGPIDVRAKLARVPLSPLVTGTPEWLVPGGTATGTATFGGSAAAPSARIEAELDDLTLLGVPLGKQPLRAELVSTASGERRCDAGGEPLDLASLHAAGSGRAWTLCGGKAGVRAALAFGAGGELPLRGTLAAERADLSPLFATSAEAHAGFPARASFVVDVTGGGLRAPGSLSFVLAVKELAIGEGRMALSATAPFELRAEHGALSLTGGELWGEHTRLTLGVEGALPHAKLKARGTIAASALLAAVPVPLVSAAFGEVAIEAALPLDGAPASFLLHPDGVIAHLGPGVKASKLQGTIALEHDALHLRDVTALVGGGTLRVAGTLEREGTHVTAYHLALTAQDVAIEPAPRFALAFDADTTLRSTRPGAPPTLAGRVQVERFVYGRRIELPEALIALNAADRRERASYDPARDRVAFDLTLESAVPLLVRNSMIDAELRVQGTPARLQVRGTDQRIGLLGALAVDRGRVLFHGDEFEIARGAVRFGEETRVAPVFELRAVAKKRTRKDASIVLEAKGDRETFSLDVRCDASGARVLARPFGCEFAHDALRCDTFEQLVALWSCPVRTELSQAAQR